MMVVHEDSDSPVEVPVTTKSIIEQKSYIIVKNHVKELSNIAQNTTRSNSIDGKSLKSTEEQEVINIKQKSCRKRKKNDQVSSISTESYTISRNTTEIDPSDLEELKTVYTKCKQVIKRIENKYGHLLNIDTNSKPSSINLKRKTLSETYENECNCKTRKKIVFDDEGRQSTIDLVTEKHICAQKMNNIHSRTQEKGNIAVEYQDVELGLPDNLQELGSMLRDPDLQDTYRNKILDKIRSIKQEYLNEIKFNKHIIIEKLKSNPDEMLDFKGTNLEKIPGYC